MIYTYLYILCESKVILNVNGVRSVYLLCDNSLKTQKTKLNRILQSYATDFKYVDLFPSHRQQAVDFYAKKVLENRNKLMIMLGRKLPYINGNHYNNCNNNPHYNHSKNPNRNPNKNQNTVNFMDKKRITMLPQTQNGQRIYPFNDLLEILGELITSQNQQQFVMSNLSGRITTLEHNRINTDLVIDNQELFGKLDEMSRNNHY